VLDGLPNDLLTSSVNDGHGVIVAVLVDASGQAAVGRLVGQGIWGTLHDSLLAAEPSGEGTRRSVPERRVAH
jgi:hypothetical protein